MYTACVVQPRGINLGGWSKQLLNEGESMCSIIQKRGDLQLVVVCF